MTWLTRVTPDAGSLRVEISSGGSEAEGWVTPRELVARYASEECTCHDVLHASRCPVGDAMERDYAEIQASDNAVELEPGVDLVLEQEVVMAEEQCAWLDCGERFEQKPVGNASGRPYRYCEEHRGKKDHRKPPVQLVEREPVIDRVTPEAVALAALPRPMAKYRGLLPANPYDAVIADLVAKRDQLDAAIEALRAIAGAA